ncbi:MAG: hypothetical protein ACKV2T_30455, partial [Kofleriaceae bacterium]
RIQVRHRDGALILPPPASSCVLATSTGEAADVWFDIRVGGDCNFAWAAMITEPIGSIPIKVRP